MIPPDGILNRHGYNGSFSTVIPDRRTMYSRTPVESVKKVNMLVSTMQLVPTVSPNAQRAPFDANVAGTTAFQEGSAVDTVFRNWILQEVSQG